MRESEEQMFFVRAYGIRLLMRNKEEKVETQYFASKKRNVGVCGVLKCGDVKEKKNKFKSTVSSRNSIERRL